MHQIARLGSIQKSGLNFGWRPQSESNTQFKCDALERLAGVPELSRINQLNSSTGEFDPGSERTLAAGLTHASRTRTLLRELLKWRTGEERVGNLPSGGGQHSERNANTA